MTGKWNEGLRTLLVPLDSLTPDPRNARVHSERNRRAIRTSLERHGQQKPIVVRPDGVIVAGNGTWGEALELGWSHVAAVVYDGPAASEYGVIDNRSAELATWNPDVLGEIALELSEQDSAFEMQTQIGFNLEELQELFPTAPEEKARQAPSAADMAFAAAKAEQAAQIAMTAADMAKEAADATKPKKAPGLVLLVECDNESSLEGLAAELTAQGYAVKRIS